MFYIDLRTPGYLEDFAAKAIADTGMELIKGKVGKVQEHPGSRDLLVTAEDILGQRKITREYDLVVLAVGIVPQSAGLPGMAATDEFGFVRNGKPGVYAAGCVNRPAEVAASVRDATGAALRALQCRTGQANHG